MTSNNDTVWHVALNTSESKVIGGDLSSPGKGKIDEEGNTFRSRNKFSKAFTCF